MKVNYLTLITTVILLSKNIIAQGSVNITPNLTQVCNSDSCYDFMAEYSSSGEEPGPIIYAWSTGDSMKNVTICIQSDTIVSVEAFDSLSGSLLGVDTVDISVVVKPTFTDTPKMKIVCVDSCTILNAPVGINYVWREIEGTVIGSSASVEVCPDVQSTYYVTYDYFNCPFADTVQVNVVDTCNDSTVTFINTVSENVVLAVYPNPTNRFVVIDALVNDVTNLILFNQQGQEIFNTHSTKELDLLNFPSGLYFLKVIRNSQIDIIEVIKESP